MYPLINQPLFFCLSLWCQHYRECLEETFEKPRRWTCCARIRVWSVGGERCWQQRQPRHRRELSFVNKSGSFISAKLHWNIWNKTSRHPHEKVRPGERKRGGEDRGCKSPKHTHTHTHTHPHTPHKDGWYSCLEVWSVSKFKQIHWHTHALKQGT